MIVVWILLGLVILIFVFIVIMIARVLKVYLQMATKQEVINLHHIGMSTQVIASHLGISEQAVCGYLCHSERSKDATDT